MEAILFLSDSQMVVKGT